MRTVVLAAALALSVSGCAADVAREKQLAIDSCHEVGVSESDPQFSVCTTAMRQLRRENALEDAYRNAIRAVPPSRRVRQSEPFVVQ